MVSNDVADFHLHLDRWPRKSSDCLRREGVSSTGGLNVTNRDFYTVSRRAETHPAGENHCEWMSVDTWGFFVCVCVCLVAVLPKNGSAMQL